MLCEGSEGVGVGFGVDGLGDVAMSSGGELGGRQAISCRMDLCLGGWYMGMNFLRNFLFLSVCLPDMSILHDEVLVKLADFNDYASPVPFVWVRASLVLDPHLVTYL